MVPTIEQLGLVLVLAVSFLHYMQAGVRTFEGALDGASMGASLGALSFTAGALISLYAGVYLHLALYNGLVSILLVASAVALYEWARRTIAGRRFYVGLSDGVPDAVCDDGPYAHIRHPIYASYILSSLALFAGFPHALTGGLLVLNVVLFGYMSMNDERVIAKSAIALDYAAYRKRVGRFFPRLLSLSSIGT